MKQAEVLAKLQEVFDGIFLEKVAAKPELSAADVEEWDSLMQISLVIAVEQKFRVRFRVGEVETARNLGEVRRSDRETDRAIRARTSRRTIAGIRGPPPVFGVSSPSLMGLTRHCSAEAPPAIVCLRARGTSAPSSSLSTEASAPCRAASTGAAASGCS